MGWHVRAERVDADAFACVNHGELTRHCEDGALGCGVSDLRGGSAHDGYKGGGVDDGAADVEVLGLVGGVVAHGDDGVLAAVPDALDVDGLGEVPDLFFGVERVVVGGVHDAGVVELSKSKGVSLWNVIRLLGGVAAYHDVETAKLVYCTLDNRRHLVLLADIALHCNCLDGRLCVLEALVDKVGGLLASVDVDIGEHDASTLGGEEHCAFTTDAAAIIEPDACEKSASVQRAESVWRRTTYEPPPVMTAT